MNTAATTQELEQEMMVQRKIMELQSALFFTESASIIKLPTHVISEVEIDEEGNLWFAIPKPVQHIDAFDKEIPAKLDFFKKGLEFFVKVRGTAHLLIGADDISSEVSAEMRERMLDERSLGVMVRVAEMELIDNSPKTTQNWLQSSRSQLSSWFF